MIPSAKPAKLGLKDAVRDLETENHNLDGRLREAMREIEQLKARIVEERGLTRAAGRSRPGPSSP